MHNVGAIVQLGHITQPFLHLHHLYCPVKDVSHIGMFALVSRNGFKTGFETIEGIFIQKTYVDRNMYSSLGSNFWEKGNVTDIQRSYWSILFRQLQKEQSIVY